MNSIDSAVLQMNLTIRPGYLVHDPVVFQVYRAGNRAVYSVNGALYKIAGSSFVSHRRVILYRWESGWRQVEDWESPTGSDLVLPSSEDVLKVAAAFEAAWGITADTAPLL